MKHLKQNHEETVQQWKNKVEKLKQTTWEHICPESIVRRKKCPYQSAAKRCPVGLKILLLSRFDTRIIQTGSL